MRTLSLLAGFLPSAAVDYAAEPRNCACEVVVRHPSGEPFPKVLALLVGNGIQINESVNRAAARNVIEVSDRFRLQSVSRCNFERHKAPMVTSSMDKLKNAFVNVLGVSPDGDFESIAYGQTQGWDSIAHMALIAEIETAFDIMLPTDDVIGMSSFLKAQEIVSRNGISFP
jgi:acyl carrier protein